KRPELCGNVDDKARCVYTHHYSEVGKAFGFRCSEITNVFVPYPHYPTSAILMGTDAITGIPHSVLWTYTRRSDDTGFAMDPAGHYLRFRLFKINEWKCKLWHLEIGNKS